VKKAAPRAEPEAEPVDRELVLQVAARAGLELTAAGLDVVAADLTHLLQWAETLPVAVAPPEDELAPRRRADVPILDDAQAILDQAPDVEGSQLRTPPVLP